MRTDARGQTVENGRRLSVGVLTLCIGCTWGVGGCSNESDRTDRGAVWSQSAKVELAGVTIDVDTRRLPQPEYKYVDAPSYTAAELSRATEVESLIIQRYQGYRILATTQMYSGDIYDWVDPITVPGALAEPPPKRELSDPPNGVRRAMSEIDAYPELRGPSGTMPILRPSFTPYVRGVTNAKSIDEFVTKYQKQGQPAGQTRLYAGAKQDTSGFGNASGATGAVGLFNAWGTSVAPGTFSLSELNIFCPGSNIATDLEHVGVVMSTDRANFDNTTRLQVEFGTAGNSQGNNVGGWHGIVTGFVQSAGAPSPGFAITPLSVANGSQTEMEFYWYLYQGGWWLSVQGTWLGYYPLSLFNIMNTKGCFVQWYGEVFDPTPTSWTNANMGSGEFASQGFQRAAYISWQHWRDAQGYWRWLDANAPVPPPVDATCYTTSAIYAGVPTDYQWIRHFYYGGPGGDAAGCN